MVKIQTPHRIRFNAQDECYVKFIEPIWYPEDDEAAVAERNKRQLI